MRLGVVTTSYPRAPDDPAGTFVAGHVRWLRAQGHEVEVIAAGDPAGGRAGQGPDQAGVIRVPAPAGLFYSGGAPDALAAGRASLPGAAGFSAGLAIAVARRAPRWDAICAHWLLPCAAAAALVAPRRPLLAIAHSGDVHLALRLGLGAPLAAALAARRARLVFVTDGLRQAFASGARFPASRRQVEDALVCPMGIDVARFRAMAAGPREPRMVLFLGRLVAIKGVAVLLEAIARIPAATLVVAGDGPARPALTAAARARGLAVQFTGEVRGPARDRLLARAQVVALPSVPVEGQRTEGLPQVALEAMAAGAALVASRTGGLAELPDGVALRTAPGDAGALAEAIAGLLDRPAERQAQVERAAHWVAAHDWSTVGPALWQHWM